MRGVDTVLAAAASRSSPDVDDENRGRLLSVAAAEVELPACREGSVDNVRCVCSWGWVGGLMGWHACLELTGRAFAGRYSLPAVMFASTSNITREGMRALS